MSRHINGIKSVPLIAADLRGTVHSGWQDITQASIRLLVVSVYRLYDIAEVSNGAS